MMFLQRSCLLAGTLGLFVMVVPVSKAQQANSQPQSGQNSATANPGAQQQSPAYEQGYRQGTEDRSHGREAYPGSRNWQNSADETAYKSGYQAGYCRYEGRGTGFYNGVYRSDGLPVLLNGYYGYNAPDPYCERARKPTS